MAGDQVGSGEVHKDDIRVHAGDQHAAFGAAALGLGTGDRCHHQGSGGGKGGGISGGGPLAQSGTADHLKHIQISAFQRAAGTQRHVHAGFYGFQNGSGWEAGAGGGNGGCHSGDFLFAQELPLVRLQTGAARGGGGDVEKPMAVQQLAGTHACTVHAGFGLVPALGQMKLHADALLAGIARKRLPQLIVAGIFAVDTGIDPDAAVVVVMPFFHHPHQLLALFVGIEVEILVFVDEPVGRLDSPQIYSP